ncbi:MAG: hypothetical protein ACSHXK_06050 [Oceanococcus sp.]
MREDKFEPWSGSSATINKAFQVVLIFVLGALTPSTVFSHGFGAAYNLPVPLELYHWGAAATLILSFVIVGLFWSKAAVKKTDPGFDISERAPVRRLRQLMPLFQALSVFVLILCIVTGFFGSRDPLRNFSPVFFWVIFVLVFSYLLVFIGDAWAALNPFRSLSNLLARVWSGSTDGIFQYPKRWADWPALVLYLGFIWFELFSHRTPKTIAAFLLAYSILNLAGVVLIGRRHWFRHCEFFSVFFRLVALMAPIDYRRDEAGPDGAGQKHLRLRLPLSGLIHERPEHVSTVVFVLAMISTTAMDGLQATQWWVGLFWQDPAGIFTQLAGASPMRIMETLMPVYIAWETFWLVISPFVYLAAYLAALWLAKLITRSSRPLMMLAMDFSYSLLPIALVYNITHYWTLITTHGLKIFSLISDPFGWRWDLFGTAMKFRAPILPDMAIVWHSQVGLILFGHILSVWIAHQIALRVWPTRGQAMFSQLPILMLMVSFTVFGLWVLAQPLTAILPR